jgi:hypothetical protein
VVPYAVSAFGRGLNGAKRETPEKLTNCQNNVCFSDLCNLAELVGFRFDRQSGSHKIYRHDKHPGIMNFQDCNGQAKPLQVKQLLSFIVDHNLDEKGQENA